MGAGFATIIILMVAVELISIYGTNRLAELTVKLYQHPLIVSNAVLEIKTGIISIHRNMKDVVLARTSEDLESAILKAEKDEKRALENLDIAMDRFLGDKSRIIKVRESFTDWKTIRNEVIELSRAGQYLEATEITTGKGASQVMLLTEQIEGLVYFTRVKAEEFLADSKKQHQNHNDFIYTLIFITLLFAIIVAAIVTTGINTVERHLERSEQRLRRTDKMNALGKLTGGIAHDYNNMLGVILGYAELLERALSDQPKLAGYAHKIRHAGDRGAKLTNKLLSFSRTKKDEADCVNLNYILQNYQQMLEKTLTARIQLKFDLAANLWVTWLDENDLEDSVLNICINAMHAIKATGQLTIRTSNEHLNKLDAQPLGMMPGDYVLLSITDNGSGMDAKTRSKIFEPFFSTKGEQGTGLGLSQVYGFIERSNGAVQVYSEPEQGTRITLYFPRYYIDNCGPHIEEEFHEPEINGNESILVVDDEVALLNLSCEILSQHGYEVVCTESATEALKILEHTTIDVLMTDVIMPEMDGYQLAAIVKKKYPTIKIQLLSGFTDEGNIAEVDESLRRNLLTKPFNAQALLQKIHDLLKMKVNA